MINRRVSLFYQYPLKAFHHMVCLCTLDGVCEVCPGTSELVGQHSLQWMKETEDCMQIVWHLLEITCHFLQFLVLRFVLEQTKKWFKNAVKCKFHQ